MKQRREETFFSQNLKICKTFIDDENEIELVEGLWPIHIAFEVDTIGPIQDGERFVEQKDYRIKFIEDPDGNWIELVEVKK